MINKTTIQPQPQIQPAQKNTNYRNFQPYDPDPHKQQLYPLYTYSLQFKLPYISQIEKPQFLSWYVSPAYDNTYVIRPRKAKDKKLKHIDSNGQIINQLQQQGAYSIHMFTDWQVTIWVKQGIKKSYKIVQWDLKKNQVINLQWKPSINGALQFLTFAQTKLIGIIEKSFGAVKISYIQSPLSPNNNQPIFQLHLKKFPNKLRYMGKLNNHSGFGWLKFQQTQQYIDNLTLYKFDLRQNTQNIQQYILENPIKKNKIQLQDIWQPQYGVIYLRFRGGSISQTDFLTKYQNYEKNKNITPLLQQQKIIYDIFWDYKNKKYKPIDFISQNQDGNSNKNKKHRNRNRNLVANTNLNMKKQYIVQFSSGYRGKNHITYKDIGQFDHTIKMVGIKTPIIYINAEHYQNIKIKQLQSNQVIDQNLLGNYDICCPLFDSYLYMSQSTNYVKNHVVFNIQFKKIMPIVDIKQLYAYFIMEITDNCDEDLICYVIQLNSQAVNQMEIKQQNQQIMEQQRQMEQEDQQEQQQEQQQELDRRIIFQRRNRPRNARGRQDMQQQQN